VSLLPSAEHAKIHFAPLFSFAEFKLIRKGFRADAQVDFSMTLRQGVKQKISEGTTRTNQTKCRHKFRIRYERQERILDFFPFIDFMQQFSDL